VSVEWIWNDIQDSKNGVSQWMVTLAGKIVTPR
jgi:hypothetical protein